LIITDASFLVIALGDDGAEGASARARLHGEDLAAPHLIDLEVTSVLRSALRAGRMTAPRASQALQDLADLDIERVVHTALLARVWDLRDNYTAYDASYIALAELFQAPLLTYDAKMARGAGARCTFEIFPEPP
jgi:predicted nucleic acid-binding protein